jgi:hypothetical protein
MEFLNNHFNPLMGFVITGCANLMILGEIPSYPVAFLIFNLFICLVTKSSFIGLKYNLPFLKRIIVLIKVITALSVSCQQFLNFMKELYLTS